MELQKFAREMVKEAVRYLPGDLLPLEKGYKYMLQALKRSRSVKQMLSPSKKTHLADTILHTRHPTELSEMTLEQLRKFGLGRKQIAPKLRQYGIYVSKKGKAP